MTARVQQLALILFAACVIACGGSQTDSTTGAEAQPPPPQPVGPASASGSSEATAVVGAAGGTFSLSNGGRLEIPRGAFDEEIEVTFSVGADGQAFGDRENQRPLGPMLNVRPAIASNGDPIVISIPEQPIPNGWSPDDLAFAIEEVAEEQRAMDTLGTVTRWNFFHANVQNGRLSARAAGLPGHRVQFGVAR